MTKSELIATGYTAHHTARCRGYVSRKADESKLDATPYKGRFGEGYTINTAARDSSQYCYITYYVR